MTPFILYQLKVALCIMMFTGTYFILFRKETFYKINRFYLLGTFVFSALLPLLRIPDFNQPQVQAVSLIINSVTTDASPVPAFSNAPKTPVIIIVYRIMMIVFTFHLCYHLAKLLVFVLRNRPLRLDKYRIISLSKRSQSFSFFRLIFITSSINSETDEGQILQHEIAHARQWHSIDIMIIQIIKIFQWFNPFIYLAERAIQETHEYLADEAVLEQNGDSGRYRLLLVARVFGVQPGIVSLFNYSLIKNRLIMMTKEKSPLRNRWKYLAVLPVALFVGFMLSCTNRDSAETDPPISNIDPETANAGIDLDQITDQDSVYAYVDNQAQFQGGTLEAFREWVQKKVEYPKEAIEKGISGKVFVQFTVSSVGKVDRVKVLRGVDPLLDEETVRVISSSPEWVPGEYKGRAVKQQFVMPVIFQLSDKNNAQKGMEEIVVDEKVKLSSVEQPARFQGGDIEAFREWVQKNLEYPKKAVEQRISGKVTVQIIIDSKGKIGSAKILRGVDPLLDEETIRVIRLSPEWEPAMKDGQPVSQEFVMPVIFSLY